MHLTESEFAQLQAARQTSTTCAQKPVTVPQPAKPGLIRQMQHGPNQSELAFENEVLYWRKLRGEIERYEFEPIRLRLANGVTYTPDWCVWFNRNTGPSMIAGVIFYEVKGEKRRGRVVVRDDASAKIKIAATRYPEFKFVLVWKDPATSTWNEQEVLR